MKSRILGAIACWLVAFNCAEKSLGLIPQAQFTESALWVWGVVAFGWLVAGFSNALSIRDNYRDE